MCLFLATWGRTLHVGNNCPTTIPQNNQPREATETTRGCTLATLLGSNSKYVSQVIHEVHGTSFNGYVHGYRVNLARERLTDVVHYGNYTIKAIGESLGFKSQTSFTNIFKRATGITPAMYQKIASEDASGRQR